jgi:RluA family pseudouridine synthase
MILYRDEHLLAIDKPAGMPSVRERWSDADSALVVVWDLLRADDPDAPKPRVVHRLDKETSGVLLFATSLPASRALSRQFRDREVEKTYTAIVLGTPPEEEGRIEVLIEEDPKRPGRVTIGHRGKESVTDWRRAEAFHGYSRLEVRPRTGRTHQIRVSLMHLGYPLLVDPKYGGRPAFLLSEIKRGYKHKKGRPELPLCARVSLHAERIELDHPVTGERVEVSAETPKDLLLSLKYLRRYRPLAGMIRHDP